MPEAKPATTKRAPSARKRTATPAAKPRARRRKPTSPTYDQIAERAYFIHLEEGSSDEVAPLSPSGRSHSRRRSCMRSRAAASRTGQSA